MKRFTQLTLAMMAVTFCSQAWLGTVAPALAAPVTDTFELKVTIKQFCEGNPKFFETLKAPVNYGVTLTLTRDVNDVSATIGGTGSESDVIPMKGLIFPRNKSGSKAELVLSGVNPGNDDHFITGRGQATFDTLGNLTKVTGTIVFQITDTYSIDKSGTQSDPPGECFASGTVGTGKKKL